MSENRGLPSSPTKYVFLWRDDLPQDLPAITCTDLERALSTTRKPATRCSSCWRDCRAHQIWSRRLTRPRNEGCSPLPSEQTFLVVL